MPATETRTCRHCGEGSGRWPEQRVQGWVALDGTVVYEHSACATRATEAAMAARAADLDATATVVYLRFGAAPASGRSWNARDGFYEAGVSVYRAWQLSPRRFVLDLRGLDALSALCIAERGQRVYRVTGRAVGTGADGEPLLADVTLTALSRTVQVEGL